MIKRIVLLLALFNAGTVFAVNSEGYVKIIEVKAWSTTIDVYLENAQEHGCAGSLKTRFLADSSKNHHVSFILSAYMAGKSVSLSYSCNDNGHPLINGVRVR